MSTEPSWHDSAYYEITVKGVLGNRWREWFEGMTIKSSDGVTTIAGDIADQAALHGLLTRIRNLGLTLITVTRIESE